MVLQLSAAIREDANLLESLSVLLWVRGWHRGMRDRLVVACGRGGAPQVAVSDLPNKRTTSFRGDVHDAFATG